jgi:transposase
MAQERIPGVTHAEWNALPFAVRAYIEFLEKQVERIPFLEARLAALEAQVAKNSSNSHKPPSSDGPGKPPRTQSEREKSGKKPGGQGGHSGSTLKKSLTPDHRVRHSVRQCGHCNLDLSLVGPSSVEERQIFDLPSMKLECTAHEVEKKDCPGCGAHTQAAWPDLLARETSAAVYGPNLRGFGIYLTAGQLLPYGRASDVIKDLLGQSISQGTLVSWTGKASHSLASTEACIKDALATSLGAVNFDETGIRSEGKGSWLHSASNEWFTHFSFHEKRGGEAIEDIGILPRFRGIAIHDRWAPYFQFEDCAHGLCGSHLLRDLRFIMEQEREPWAKAMRKCLRKMNEAVKKAKANGQTRFNAQTIDYWEAKYQRILKRGLLFHAGKNETEGVLAKPGQRGRKKQREGKNLLDALDRRREWVLLFLKDFSVPFTNNRGEQDIRMTKVKLKISGCFRSSAGARHFCRIRGYISTARKQGWNVLDAMKSVFLGSPLQLACLPQ